MSGEERKHCETLAKEIVMGPGMAYARLGLQVDLANIIARERASAREDERRRVLEPLLKSIEGLDLEGLERGAKEWVRHDVMALVHLMHSASTVPLTAARIGLLRLVIVVKAIRALASEGREP